MRKKMFLEHLNFCQKWPDLFYYSPLYCFLPHHPLLETNADTPSQKKGVCLSQ